MRQEIRAGKEAGGRRNQGQPTRDASTLFGRGEDPARAGGLCGEGSIAELCRREGIASSMYYGWSKEFLEAGKRRQLRGLEYRSRAGERPNETASYLVRP